MRHTGIVLQTFFSKQSRLALLDATLGRIDGIVYRPIGSPGDLLSYEVSDRGRCYLLSQVSIEDSPLSVAQEDILFLHHLLELSYACMPIGSCTVGVFELLKKLYRPHRYGHTRQYKKIFLYQLLTHLGIMSSSYRMSAASLYQVQGTCLDRFVETCLVETSEKELDDWLEHSIAEYANLEKLKTVHFLNLSRII